MSDNHETIDFGYKDIPIKEKNAKVAEIFHSVASQYDVMNDLMSLGVHRIWKHFTAELSALQPGDKVLDIAGGTGDMSKKFSRLVGEKGEVILADINYSMLEEGRKRLLDQGYVNNLSFVQANAECLPFPDNYFNCVCIAFGLRNVTRKQKAIESMHRVLKPGGRLLILEFSKPTFPGLKPIYDAYSFSILPWLGKVIAKDSESYRYLAESIRRHPDQNTLKNMMEKAGFIKADYHNMSGGIVAIHKGIK